MEMFELFEWTSTFHEEEFQTNKNEIVKCAYCTISDWKIPFTFEDWSSKLNVQITEPMPTENIYVFCSKRLKRLECIRMVRDASQKLELDPGFIKDYEKMASFYILKLLAVISRKNIWKEWSKIPMTENLLKDEVFCLAVVALHPILYGKLHPIGRNNRRVFLEALAGWDLPNYSIMQFVHPNALKKFQGQEIMPSQFVYEIQYHKKDFDKAYWLFNDPNVVMRAMGSPGKRRWFEMQFVGPLVVDVILKQRRKHGNSLEPLNKYLLKNMYIKH